MQPYPKADVIKRVFAAIIDGLIAGLPSFIPFIGALLGTLYTLTKDAIVYESTGDVGFKNRSIGKKLMNLEIALESEEDYVDWSVSIRRNLPLAIGSLIMIIPILGWIIGPFIALLFALIELILVITEPAGRRLGDQIGKTQVIQSPDPVYSRPPNVSK